MDNFITKYRIEIAKTVSFLLDLIFGIGFAYLIIHFGIIYLLSVQKLFNLSFLKISYILPMIIILMGIRIVYTAIREKR